MDLEQKIVNLIADIEDILEIEPDFPETIKITKQELDLTPLEDKIGDKENKEIDNEIDEEE